MRIEEVPLPCGGEQAGGRDETGVPDHPVLGPVEIGGCDDFAVWNNPPPRLLRDEVAGAANVLATRLAQKSDARVQGKALSKRLDEKYGKH